MYKFCFLVAFLLGFNVSFVTGAETEQPTTATQKAAYPSIVLYSAEVCPHCKNAKKYMDDNKIPYVNRDVLKNKAFLKELNAICTANGLTKKECGVPVLVVDNKIQFGFNEKRLDKSIQAFAVAQAQTCTGSGCPTQNGPAVSDAAQKPANPQPPSTPQPHEESGSCCSAGADSAE